jgi:hypothetical protein
MKLSFLPGNKVSAYAKSNEFEIALIEIHALSISECHNLFSRLYNYLPQQIRLHRKYFENENRGFGERAFHSAWFWLFKHYFACKSLSTFSALEIGVYRGQTVTLWPLIAEIFSLNISVTGISPFDSSGDTASKYLDNLSYYDDVIKNAKYFNVQDRISLVKGHSNLPEGLNAIASGKWDLIYIDGSHDHEIVKSDYLNACKHLNCGGILAMDDSSLFAKKVPTSNRWRGFHGHSGPSEVAVQVNMVELIHILSIGHLNFFLKISG